MTEIAFPGGVREDDPDLTDRQRLVFLALVSLYRRHPHPVSSDALSRIPGIRWSPAGIRSTLVELETLGLIQRVHALAGRFPTAAGYTFHIRHALTPQVLPEAVLREVDLRLRQVRGDVEALLAEASRVLSSLSRQLGLAVATAFDREELANLELSPLGPRRTLMILRLGSGATHTLVLDLPNLLNADDLGEAEDVLKSRLTGLTLGEVRERLATDPELVEDATVRIVASAARASWDEPGTTLFSSGAGEFATQPEFADREKLASLLHVLETGPPLDRIMMGPAEGQPAVQVALDQNEALEGLSLVSFSLPGRRRSAVGVLGPLRMDYARCVAVVEAVGARVAAYL
jgi:heat-inducible transcriptional repressor